MRACSGKPFLLAFYCTFLDEVDDFRRSNGRSALKKYPSNAAEGS